MTNWPHPDYLGWRETCSALHLYLQIVGKYRLAHTPWLNHSWNATFYVTPRGLATSPIPDGPGIEIRFDFLAHQVVGTCGNGHSISFDLEPTTVATFHKKFVHLISELGGTPKFNGRPNEVPYPIPFAEDDRDRPYDREAVRRFHQALVAIEKVFTRFRTSFLGKSSPVHLFWGSFDLATTRFSGRRHRFTPAVSRHCQREAYDREVSSAGFWPGGGGLDYPAFYAYAYPSPGGYRAAPVQPDSAFWHEGLSEFILPYDAVQSAADPNEALIAFLVSTYEAAADLGHWDRDLLECAHGQPRQVRAPDASTAQDTPPMGEEQVEREDGPAKGRYRLVIHGVEAKMAYSRAGAGLIIIDHTDVPRGRCVAAKSANDWCAKRWMMRAEMAFNSYRFVPSQKRRSTVIRSGRTWCISDGRMAWARKGLV